MPDTQEQRKLQKLESLSLRAPESLKKTFRRITHRLHNELYSLAELDLQKALISNSTDPEYWFALGEYFSETGQIEEAIQCFKEAIWFKPSEAVYHSKLGDCLYSIEEDKLAEECYKEAIWLDPTNPEGHCALGWLLYDNDRFQEAETCFRESLEHQGGEETHNYHYGLGRCLEKQHRFANAAICYLTAEALYPYLEEYSLALSKLYERWDRPNIALKHAEAALEKIKENTAPTPKAIEERILNLRIKCNALDDCDVNGKDKYQITIKDPEGSNPSPQQP